MSNKNIYIYWDFENVRISNKIKTINAITILNSIREKLKEFGIIRDRKVYIDAQSPTEINTPRGELNLSGWSIIDVPHRGKKETIDKKMVSDILWTVVNEEKRKSLKNLMICIITSDTDFSEELNNLRDEGIYTCLIYGTNATKMLIDSSDLSIDWHKEILKNQDSQCRMNDKTPPLEHMERNTVDTKKSNLKIQRIQKQKINAAVPIGGPAVPRAELRGRRVGDPRGRDGPGQDLADLELPALPQAREERRCENIIIGDYDMNYLLSIIEKKCNENKVRMDIVANTWYSRAIDKKDKKKLRLKLNALIRSGVTSGILMKDKEYVILKN